VQTAQRIAAYGVPAISLADTIGAADPARIGSLLRAVGPKCGSTELGVHLHSTRAEAAAKVRAAYEAGCRRFDSAMGGLGGCPFAQDELVGNLPTEEVLHALSMVGVELPLQDRLAEIVSLNNEIGRRFTES
jgi:hydroxymethylglutaryl-CoA lyase